MVVAYKLVKRKWKIIVKFKKKKNRQKKSYILMKEKLSEYVSYIFKLNYEFNVNIERDETIAS